jgi:hypothetical protein
MSSDALETLACSLSDDELATTAANLRGNAKRAGSRARRLSLTETVVLVAVMAEQARRVTPAAETGKQ